jgi:vacuolar-type H+-ATPase subunit I/STV1
MSLKNAAFFALIGVVLLTVLLAVGFVRDVSSLLAGAIAAMALLKSGIYLLASLGVAVFLYVFHLAQS